MSSKNKLPKIFKLAAKRKSTTIIPMVLLFIMSIIIMVLSAQQTKPINEPLDGEFGDYAPTELYFKNWEEAVCGNTLIYFLSPFAFDLVVTETDWDGSSYSYGIGVMSCPWRERNTIFRLTIDCLIVVATISIAAVLITEKGKEIWPVLTWIHWVLFLFMFVVFILDCDSIYSGMNSCNKEFELDGDEPVILKLLEDAYDESASSQSSWDWDSSSGWLSGFFWLFFDPADYTEGGQFDCMVTPYIYTALADIAAVIFGFCVWRIGRHYKFDKDDDDDNDNKDIIDITSIDNKQEGTAMTLGANDKTEMAVFPPNSSTPDNLNSDKIISPPSGSTNPPKKEESPDPFAEFNVIGNNNAYGDNAANQQTTDGNNATDNYMNPFDD